MGVDIHEYRRFHGKADPNPAAYGVYRAGKGAQDLKARWQAYARARKAQKTRNAFRAKVGGYGR